MSINNIKKKGRLICPFLFVLFTVSCGADKEWQRIDGKALGTSYSIQFKAENGLLTQQHFDSLLERFDHALSTYNKESYLSALNARNWDYVMAHQGSPYIKTDTNWLGIMMRSSIECFKATKGAFDPSVGVLFDLWSRAKKEQTEPLDSLLSWALNHRGFTPKVLTNWKLAFTADSLSTYNFNAIAKGYAVDVLAEFLDFNNVKEYMVEIGGELRVKGTNPQGETWRLGVNKPTIGSEVTSVFEVIELQSGIYGN